jgi:DNA-binding NtrC family response regulator
MTKQKVLVVEDDKYILLSYQELFRDENLCVDYFDSGLEAFKHFQTCPSDYVIAFVDHNLKHDTGIFSDGSELVKELKNINDDLVVVIASADTSDEAYQKWIEVHADKILSKPITKQKVMANIKSAFAKNYKEEHISPTKGNKDYARLINMIGVSNEFQVVAKNVIRYSEVDSDVLILGETGTGKDLIAQAIHYNSKRAKTGQFIAINCSSFKGDSNLMESELFGHERGAFTGAISQKAGVFEVAHGGTVFLDEIHHLSKEAQAKLLRVLQEKKVKRVGSTKEIFIDFRLICAGKPKLREMCRGSDPDFLPDLFFRISTLDLEVPPLRERTEDISPLINHFKKAAEAKFQTEKDFSPSAMRALKSYSWPGNVRELENVIERLFVKVDDRVIRKKWLPDEILQTTSISEAIAELDLETLEKLQQEQVKKLILTTLKRHDHNILQVANSLKSKRTTLISKMKTLGIFDSSPEERNGMLKIIINNFSHLRM